MEREAMNFHATTAPRIRETSSTCTMEYRIALHYSDSRDFAGDIVTLDLDKNIKELHRG